MANVSVIKLKIRRGTDAQRKLIVLDQGEIGYTTDSKRLFVGDVNGTQGGVPTAIKYYPTTTGITNATTTSTDYLYTIQTGDIVYDSTLSHIYILTGANTFYNTLTAYRQLV